MSSSTLSPRAPQSRRRQPRPKPARAIRWLTKPLSADRAYGAVEIVCGKVIGSYYLHEIPAADGRGFEVEKIDLLTPLEDRRPYHVYLAANGQDKSCECKGFLRHGHCKHVDGLVALLSR